jgi:hypothetical protein
VIDLAGHYFEDVIVSFFGMGDNAVRTVLDAVVKLKIAAAVE